jgi:hypothetical protein
VRFRGERDGVALLDETLPLADLLGKRLTLSYVPANPEDAEVIASFGGVAAIPPYLVEVKPVIKSGGITIAAGDAGVGLGVRFDLRIDLIHPGGTETISTPPGREPHRLRTGRARGATARPGTRGPPLPGGGYLDRWNRSTPTWPTSWVARCAHRLGLHGDVGFGVGTRAAILYQSFGGGVAIDAI